MPIGRLASEAPGQTQVQEERSNFCTDLREGSLCPTAKTAASMEKQLTMDGWSDCIFLF